MELASGDGALRTLKHRSKVPSGAIDTAAELLNVLYPNVQVPSLQLSPADPVESEENARDDREKRITSAENGLSTLLLYGKERWEPTAVVIAVVCDLIAKYVALSDEEKQKSGLPLSEEYLTREVKGLIHANMEHYEPRVRMAIAKLIGTLAKWDLEWVSAEFTPQIVESVLCNLTRSPDFEETGFEEVDDNISVNGMETPPQSPMEGTPRTPSTPHRLDDVSGWKALETSLCALKYIMKGAGEAFLAKKDNDGDKFQYLTPEIFELVTTKSCFHINRHVRVVGFDTITVLCELAPTGFLDGHQSTISDTLNKCIVRGMQDNWSQVRYAASIATRAFLQKLKEETRMVYLPAIVPRLCLNRYYVAERVQKYSQETWRLLMGENGRQIVATYANEIVDYYIDMTGHCVREAACQCIAELAVKVDSNAIRPHISRLMTALLISFYDVSGLVRDAACLATGQLVLKFPADCRPFLDELYTLWFDHLADEIWSIREDAAIALGNVIRAYGQESIDRVIPILEDYLEQAKKQPAMSQHEYEELMHSEKKHRSKQAFSCCDLDPKITERHDHHHKEPWEHTDGAIYLVRELCEVTPDLAVKYLPQVADIAILRHFPQTGVLQETIWKQLPLMCDALGKKVFKRYLELFFDPLVFTLQGTHRLAKFAARDCVARLSKQIGPSIFMGRLQANSTWLDALAPLVADQNPIM